MAVRRSAVVVVLQADLWREGGEEKGGGMVGKRGVRYRE